jgi:hypothetical protein
VEAGAAGIAQASKAVQCLTARAYSFEQSRVGRQPSFWPHADKYVVGMRR